MGYGYWGKNLLRNILDSPQSGNIQVYDIDEDRLSKINSPNVTIIKGVDYHKVIDDPNNDAVVIATPTSTHYDLAKRALLAGKHVLIEKPFCTSTTQAEELCMLAEQNELVLMVDHIYLYNPVVQQLKSYITKDSTGGINYIDSSRVNLGIYQKDTNVLWDLVCHDVSIINHLIKEKPKSVRAIGKVNLIHAMEDIVYLFLNYPSGLLVHVNASWASPVKMRKMIIGGEKRMIIYDDIEPTNKLTIYDYGQNVPTDNSKSFLIDYRLGNITIPKCDIQEPLRNVIAEFYNCILNRVKPLSSGRNAIETVRILEAAQQSLDTGGALIQL